MDNYSVIASLVLVGLFLITCPAEGYVTGYIDLSDQRIQSSPWTRQEERILKRIMSSESGADGEVLISSPHNNRPPTNQEDAFTNTLVLKPSVNEASTKDQNSQAGGKKRDGELFADEQNVKVLTNGLQNTERGIHFTAPNSAAIVILPLPLPSRL